MARCGRPLFTQNMRVRAPGRVAALHAAGALWTLGACGSRVVAAVPARGRWRRAKSKRAKRRPGTRGRSGLASRGRGVRWCGWCNLHAVLRGVACAGEAPQARGNARSHVPRVFLAPAQRSQREHGVQHAGAHAGVHACVRASTHVRTLLHTRPCINVHACAGHGCIVERVVFDCIRLAVRACVSIHGCMWVSGSMHRVGPSAEYAHAVDADGRRSGRHGVTVFWGKALAFTEHVPCARKNTGR